MENASKALIIAGAILISILLISLGIMIYNQAKDAATETSMDDFTISAFNSKFTQYGGEVNGSKVRSLINDVFSSNASASASGNGHTIEIDGGANVWCDAGGTTFSKGKLSDIKVNQKYTVTCSRAGSGTANAGYINKITID